MTPTFAVDMTGKFLPAQVIYEGKKHRCPPNFESLKCLNVTYSANQWSNTNPLKFSTPVFINGVK